MNSLAVLAEDDENAWKKSAACRDLPTEVFYASPSKEASALAICGYCPVKPECLEYALEFEGSDRDRYGIFGGMTPKDRIAELKRRNPNARVRRFS